MQKVKERIESKLSEAFKSVNEFYGVIASWNEMKGDNNDTVKRTSKCEWETKVTNNGEVETKKSGSGIIELNEGWSYRGQYVNGLFHGYGQIFQSDNLIYSGQFYDGYFEGYGKFKYHPTFSYLIEQLEWTAYFGQFKKGTITGIGELWLAKGGKIVGLWDNGTFKSKYLRILK